MIEQKDMPPGWSRNSNEGDWSAVVGLPMTGITSGGSAGHCARIYGPGRSCKEHAEQDLLRMVWSLQDGYDPRVLKAGVARLEAREAPTERALDAAEQEVTHFRARLERAEALADKQGATAQRQGDALIAIAEALGFKPCEDPTTDQMVNAATGLRTARERLEALLATARIQRQTAEDNNSILIDRMRAYDEVASDDRKRRLRVLDEYDDLSKRLRHAETALAPARERLAAQATTIREQQHVIDHLRRPLSMRIAARVARWVRG